jgi:hypothetical protein
MVLASLAIFYLQPEGSPLGRPLELLLTPQGQATVFAGLAYAAGYLWLLKAWEHLPSTVIVPCLQLASPMVEVLGAALSFLAGPDRPLLLPLLGSSLSLRAWVGFATVLVGGLLPSAGEGGVAKLLSPALWQERSMCLLMMGNMAFAVYYLLMGLVTAPGNSAAGDCSSPSVVDCTEPLRLTGAQFMALTNVVAVCSFSCYVAAQRPLRRQFASAFGLPPSLGGPRPLGVRLPGEDNHGEGRRSVHWLPRALSMLAEVANYGAMWAISLAFGLHYNAGLVAAARASLNQLTNMLCASMLYRGCGCGRGVEQLSVKLVSCAVVTVGLLLGSPAAHSDSHEE